LIVKSCHNCERQFRLDLSAGMTYSPLEEVIHWTRGNARRKLQEIVAHDRVISAEYGHRLLACPHCDTLQERFYVRVDYEGGSPRRYRAYETTFACSKCRRPLIEPGKPISQYRCFECGSYALGEDIA